MTEDDLTDTDLSSSSDSDLDDTDLSSTDDSSDSELETHKSAKNVSSTRKPASKLKAPAAKKRKVTASSGSSDSDTDSDNDPPKKGARGKKLSATKMTANARKTELDDENISDNDVPPPEGMLMGGVDVVIQGGEQERMVYKYLRTQNRPYSAQQIFENLHEKVKKSQVPKVLEALTAQGVIVEKIFGKSKIYHVNQDHMPRGDTDAMASLDYNIKQKNKEFAEVRARLGAVKNEVSGLEASPGNEEGERLIEEARVRIAEKEAQLAEIKAGLDAHKAADVDRLKHRFYLMVCEWKKRKKAAQEMMDMYLEHVAKTAKVFMNEQGIENDEAVGQDLRQYSKLCDELGCAKVKLPGKVGKK